MPELPEVETVKRSLNQLICGKVIASVTVKLPRLIVPSNHHQQFAESLKGKKMIEVQRRGKFLRFILNDVILVSHLRMEGHYGLYTQTAAIEPHTHVFFHFTDGTELRYRDVRQFGTMQLFSPGKEWLEKPLNQLGAEPLESSFTFPIFNQALGNRKTKIKSCLLNQHVVVGLGNIYVDEVLFAARIHPLTEVRDIDPAQRVILQERIVSILTKALKQGGSTIRTYVNSQGKQGEFQGQFQVYGRAGKNCAICGTMIEKIVVGGRGTCLCPQCQPLPYIKNKKETSHENGTYR